MEQVKSFCRRYRRLLLAAAYLAIFAVGVLYLRVTVNIPPEGDDKLTLNLWLYDFQRMPFWQYALQDLQGRTTGSTSLPGPARRPSLSAAWRPDWAAGMRWRWAALRWRWPRPPSGTKACTATTPYRSGRCSGL